MRLPNIFTKPVADQMIGRINKLSPSSTPQWGKMSVSQMLAHCNVTYEFLFTDKHSKPGKLMGWVLKTFVKNKVVGEKPYPKSAPTAPAFIIKEEKNFEQEKETLINNIRRTQELGEAYFDNKDSHSFGKLSKTEWNNMFQKHLDHHLTQFGV